MGERRPFRIRPSDALVALTLPVLSGCVGWGSASLPPPLTADEERTLATAHLPLTVGVVPCIHPAYSDSLVAGLQGTGLFDQVALVEELEAPPDVLAYVDRRIHGRAVVPLLTLLTFGVIPTSFDEEHGYSFWLDEPVVEGDGWHVEVSHTGTTTLGWIALFDAFRSDRTVIPFSVKGSRRMLDRLALEILEHRDVLAALAGQDGGME